MREQAMADEIVVSDDDEIVIDESRSTRPRPMAQRAASIVRRSAPYTIPERGVHMRTPSSFDVDDPPPAIQRLSEMFPFVSLPVVSFLFSQQRHTPPPPPSHAPAAYRPPVPVSPPPRLRTPSELLRSAAPTGASESGRSSTNSNSSSGSNSGNGAGAKEGKQEVVELVEDGDSEVVARESTAAGKASLTDTSAAGKGEVPIERHNAVVFDELRKAIKCPVCLENMSEMTATKCGHLFCKECIHAAIAAQHKCPTCRQKLNLRDTHPIFF